LLRRKPKRRRMPELGALAAFAVVTAVLVATPGPGVLYILGRSIDTGRTGGFASMLGIEAAELVYLAATLAGLSALLARSAAALATVRYAGAAYLVGLGVYEWVTKPRPAVTRPSAQHLVLHGFVVQILNPKVAVFFVAYFPQFLNPDASTTAQVAVLGAVYIALACAIDTAYVLFSSFVAQRMARTGLADTRIRRLSATTYIGLGLFAALPAHERS
jgi:threonine/homoserine/homoserine lactone efflux protein